MAPSYCSVCKKLKTLWTRVEGKRVCDACYDEVMQDMAYRNERYV